MSFCLTSPLWACAVLAAALATFGPWGFFVALAVVGFWAQAFGGKRLTLLEWCVILGIVIVLAGLLLPAGSAAREYARRTACMNHVSQVAKALYSFVEYHGALPPAASGANSERTWRYAILPQLDESKLYSAFRDGEAWDGPSNTAIAQTPLPLFSCPSDASTSQSFASTSYFAVVGLQAAFLPDRGRAWEEFTDRRSQTIMVLEAPGRDTPWLKPVDLSFDEALELLTNPPDDAMVHGGEHRPGFFYKRQRVAVIHAAFADGHVRAIELPLSRELAKALLTIDGGEAVDEQDFYRSTQPQLDYGRIYAFSAFVLLAVLPASKLTRRRLPAAAPVES